MVAFEAIVSGALYLVSALVLAVLASAAFVAPRDEDSPQADFLPAAALLLAAFLIVALLGLGVEGAKLSGGGRPAGALLGAVARQPRSRRAAPLGRRRRGAIFTPGARERRRHHAHGPLSKLDTTAELGRAHRNRLWPRAAPQARAVRGDARA